MADFDGTVAIVTGATTGIGSATARLLAEQGAVVEGCGLDAEAAPPIHPDVHLTTVDVSDESAIASFVADVARRRGRIDVVVTSAGIQRYGTAADTTAELWDEVFTVNVRGSFLAIKYAIPHLRARGGSIVVVSSVQAFANQSDVAAYASGKGALNALVRSIAIDEAGHGIRANAVCPASVDTPMLRAAAASFSDGSPEGAEALLASWGAAHPLGRLGTGHDIAEAIAYLAGPRSAFITGISLPVDGGLLTSLPVALP